MEDVTLQKRKNFGVPRLRQMYAGTLAPAVWWGWTTIFRFMGSREASLWWRTSSLRRFFAMVSPDECRFSMHCLALTVRYVVISEKLRYNGNYGSPSQLSPFISRYLVHRWDPSLFWMSTAYAAGWLISAGSGLLFRCRDDCSRRSTNCHVHSSVKFYSCAYLILEWLMRVY